MNQAPQQVIQNKHKCIGPGCVTCLEIRRAQEETGLPLQDPDQKLFQTNV